MYQEWRSLLFLHWKVAPSAIQEKLPSGLFADTFEGAAYLGIVPFYMHALRPKFCPPCPGISYFPELNLRTYVRDAHGRSGVWFFSLDADSALSVAIARRFFNLPYHYAKMSYTTQADLSVDFEATRPGSQPQKFHYRPKHARGKAAPGTLDHFLVERYRLFACSKNDTIHVGELSHKPYETYEVEVSDYDTELFRLNGFLPPNKAPDHAIFSPGVHVEVYPMRKSSQRRAGFQQDSRS